MNKTTVYDVWAGADHPWAPWTKPALFAQLGDDLRRADAPFGHHYRSTALPWTEVDVHWAPPMSHDTFIVVDLPGEASIHLGFTLMSRGYRPVVAINACTGAHELIGMAKVLDALREGARFPHAFPQEKSAPPAFLLDARRMRPARAPIPGAFDNRWMIFSQDLPSADFLRRQGLSRVVVVRQGDVVANDLNQVLYAWQQGGIAILTKDMERPLPPELTMVEKPFWLERLVGHPIGIGMPRRNPQGSFGARIPEPSHG